MEKCNLCSTISSEEAVKCCAFDDCPHKIGADSVAHEVTDEDLKENPELAEEGVKAGDVIGIPEGDLTLGEQAEEANENKSFIGKLADAITGK